jgi:hypothetical protein
LVAGPAASRLSSCRSWSTTGCTTTGPDLAFARRFIVVISLGMMPVCGVLPSFLRPVIIQTAPCAATVLSVRGHILQQDGHMDALGCVFAVLDVFDNTQTPLAMNDAFSRTLRPHCLCMSTSFQ